MPSGNISSYSYKQCVLTCPDGFFSVEVNSTYRCEKCMGLCLNCLSSTQCLTCQSPYIYYDIDFQCLLACPSTHYELNYVCKLCLAPCMTCLDASTCLSCSIGYYYNGTCLASCPQGTYANTTAGSCDVCASQCLSCEGSPSFCLTCVSPYLLFESSCLLGCPSALYYQLESLCLICSSPCLTCSSSSSCLSCQLGYLFSTSCLSSCQDGYYSDTLTSACRPCSSSCLTCESQTICLSCLSPLNLYSYSCISQCPSGTYAHNSICVNCLQPCSSCTNSSYCLNCSIGYLSALTLGTCLSSC